MWLIGYFILAVLLFKLYLKLTTGWCRCQVCLIGKTVIVTGANTGIGYETALDLAKRGARVILACRNEVRALEACKKIIYASNNCNVVYKILDLGSLQSVREFAEDIKTNEKRLDILINNAGLEDAGDKLSADALLLLMQTNYFGPVLLTELLLDMLKKSSGRIVNVSSIGAKWGSLTIEDVKDLNKYIGRFQQYSRTKLCNILYTISLAKRLIDTRVTTFSLHPGGVKTDFIRNVHPVVKAIAEIVGGFFAKDALEGAQTTIHCAVAQNIEHYSGEHFHDCKVVSRYSTARDPVLVAELWDETVRILELD